MTKTIYKANYAKAEKAADELLKINNVNSLPVKVKKLSKIFPDLKIRSYTWYSNKYNVSFQDLIELTDSDEGCCWYFKDLGRYLILYNDLVQNKGRIRWTIAHELGHYILKHNEITNKAILTRSSLSDKEYNIFESEANCFARELLAPSPVLRSIGGENPFFISYLCGISLEAATNVYNFLKQGDQLGIKYTSGNPIVRLFSEFIHNVKNAKWCTECNHSFSKCNANYCPVCGSKNIIKNSIFFREGDKMRYSLIELDEIGRAKQCPRCGNEDIKGRYCNVCNTYLFNKCSGFDDDDPNFQNRGSIKWHLHEEGCGQILDGHARYCHECGCTSSFYEEGLLDHWINENRQDLVSVSNIKDDDLPF